MKDIGTNISHFYSSGKSVSYPRNLEGTEARAVISEHHPRIYLCSCLLLLPLEHSLVKTLVRYPFLCRMTFLKTDEGSLFLLLKCCAFISIVIIFVSDSASEVH